MSAISSFAAELINEVENDRSSLVLLRCRAAKKAKDSHPNGILNNGSFTRSSTRGITQVPDQISSPGLDHEMDDDDDDDLDQPHPDDENHPHSQAPADSPTNSHTSDDFHDKPHSVHDDEHARSSSNHQRKRLFGRTPLPLVNDGSVINGKSNLLTIRLHLEKGKARNTGRRRASRRPRCIFSFSVK